MLMHDHMLMHYELQADNCIVELHAGATVQELGLLTVEQFSVVWGTLAMQWYLMAGMRMSMLRV